MHQMHKLHQMYQLHQMQQVMHKVPLTRVDKRPRPANLGRAPQLEENIPRRG